MVTLEKAMTFIDLSVLINERTPVYPGDPLIEIRPNGTLEKEGYAVHCVCLGTHVGTHMDAPSHMLAGGKNLDQFPLEKFSGRGVYLKIEDNFNLEVVKKASLARDDIVLFDTGMSSVYDQPRYYYEY